MAVRHDALAVNPRAANDMAYIIDPVLATGARIEESLA